MKFLFFALLVLSFAISGCCKKNKVVEFSLESLTASNTDSDQVSQIDVKVKLTNNHCDAATLKWRRVNEILPAGWQSAVCDNQLCHGGTVDNATFVVGSEISFDMKAVFYPNGESGTGSFDLLVFDPNDSTATVQAITYTAVATK